jgi:hypothetical protein
MGNALSSNVMNSTNTTTDAPKAGVVARYAPPAARFLLGAVFFVFGLNGFLNFIPPPSEPVPQGAMAFGLAMMNTGYFMQLVKGTEVLCGLLLLSNRFVPLSLVVLAPVVLNILAFHAFLAPSGVGMAIAILALTLYLAWVNRRAYAPLLRARTA